MDILDPNRAYTEPSSKPMTPPPIIIRCLGISENFNASVEVIILFLSTVIPFNVEGFDPVAKIIF